VLVDDVPELRELTRIGLEDHGSCAVVGEAGDGLQAVEEVAATRPDAVVLDLSMPRCDGLEALAELRREHPQLAIVVFSGFAQERLAQQLAEGGADGYVEKGAPVAELGTAIEAAVAHRRPEGS